MSVPASKINWRTISENDFNEIAEALIVRNRTGDGLVAQAVDGRGGDGGTDIDVRVERTDQTVEILQLKWFPEGFSKRFAPRKTQIVKSFEAAMMDNPPVWTLVIPANLTPSERRSVWAMRKGRNVRIRFIDATSLNLLLSQYPEVHDWATRDSAINALSLVGREQVALSKPGDLAAEALRLARRADGVSAYWGRSVSVSKGIVTEQLYAKRDDAVDREPLSFRVETVFGPDDSDLRQKFEEVLGYGIAKPLVLPDRIVTAITKAGPEWFAEEAGSGELHFYPAESASKEVRFVVSSFDADDRRISSISGRTSHVTSGSEGGRIVCVFNGGLSQEWLFPRDSAKPGKLNIQFKPAGSSARDILRTMQFLDSLSSASRISLSMDGRSGSLAMLQKQTPYNVDTSVRELIEDLVFLESSLNVAFEFPEEFPSPLDRVWVRTVRRLLEGRCVALPNVDGIDINLNGTRSDILETVLLGDGGALVISNDTWTIDVLGEELWIGSMGIYHAHVRAYDAEKIREAVVAGRGSGLKVHLRAADGAPFRIYSPSRMKSEEKVVAEPWDLQGIPEHPLLDACRPADSK